MTFSYGPRGELRRQKKLRKIASQLKIDPSNESLRKQYFKILRELAGNNINSFFYPGTKE
jgi:hypothetical protein